MDIEQREITVFTDGSCYPNDGTGDGGWAFQCHYNGASVSRYGWAEKTSNNAMECTAILRAFQYIPFGSSPITIYTDSTYCKNVISSWAYLWEEHGWYTATGTPVKNVELIKELIALIDAHKERRTVNVKWIKGHSGIAQNESVDVSAGRARKQRESNWDNSKHNKHSERLLHRKRMENGCSVG